MDTYTLRNGVPRIGCVSDLDGRSRIRGLRIDRPRAENAPASRDCRATWLDGLDHRGFKLGYICFAASLGIMWLVDSTDG